MTRRKTAAPPDTAVEELLRRWIGLDAATVGTAAIRRAVRTRMAASGEADAAAYAARLPNDELERDLLVEEVVVAESWFFRDSQVFGFVAGFVAMLAALPGRGPVRILSAPCAAGEEPYSIAMALLDAGVDPAQFVIDAIDVSRVALARAARGRYSANAFRNADLSFRDRWFRHHEGAAEILEQVRSRVSFARANLLEDSFLAGRAPYDVIFCRNLLIYLDTEARGQLERSLDALLNPDGVLVLGAAEPPILKGGWIPAGAASVFALRRGVRPATSPKPLSKPGAAPRPTLPRRPVETRPADPAAGLPQPRPEVAETGLKAVLAEAGTLANAGRLAEALEACERARQTLGPSPELFFLMGMLHQAAGDLDRAEGCLHKTLYLDGTHDEALLALALIATQRGDLRMAETYRQSAARVMARKAAP